MKKFFLLFLFTSLIIVIFILTVKITKRHLEIKEGLKNIDFSIIIDKSKMLFENNGSLTSFYEPKPHSIEEISADWLGYIVKIRMNNDGLNDRFNYELLKPIDTFRIITLGDSHTYGVYVQTKENWPEQLEDLFNTELKCQKYQKFEVINLGVHGYDLEYSLERFKVRGLVYRPDLVIWFVNNWNFQNINEYYFPRREQLLKIGLNDFNNESSRFEISEKIFQELIYKYSIEGIVNYQKNIVNNMRSIYKNKLIFLTYDNIEVNFDKLLEDISKSNKNIEYYKLTFNPFSNRNLAFPDRHPNQEGHKKIAQEIFKLLERDILKNCL